MIIVTDCAADMQQEEIDEFGVNVAPLFIQFPEEEISADQISPDEFYNRLKAIRPAIPTTALPSPEIFTRIYRNVLETSKEILSIHISSGLSGTLESARSGATHVLGGMIHTFDSKTLSGGQRFQVLAAARGIRSGWGIDMILSHLEKLREQTEVIYTLDTLEYLARGGRIGRVQALAGSLLKLKPIINVDHEDGKYSTAGRARTLAKSMELIAQNLVNKFQDRAVWVSVMHGQVAEQAEELAHLLSQRMNVAKLEVLRISPVLGVHTGPGIFGAAVAPADLVNH